MTITRGSPSIGSRHYYTDALGDPDEPIQVAIERVEAALGDDWHIQSISPRPLFSTAGRRDGWGVTIAATSFVLSGFIDCWGPTIPAALDCIIASMPDWHSNPYVAPVPPVAADPGLPTP